jgi:hypothetical protein
VTDDNQAAYDRIRPVIAHVIAPTHMATLRAMGMATQEIRQLRETYWRHGPDAAAAHVTNEMIDDWAWIGSSHDVAQRLLGLVSVGVTEVSVVAYGGNLDAARALIHTVGRDVIPTLGQ